MPHFTFAASPDGLVVQVLIGLRRSQVQTLRGAGRSVPSPVQLRGLIDTGADTTSVLDAALAPLGLLPVGSMMVNTASGMTVVNRYGVSLTIPPPPGAPPHNLVRHNLQVLGMSSAPLGFEMLVGLDVLAECLLLFDGRAQTFTIAF
jgi:hypothetical protein